MSTPLRTDTRSSYAMRHAIKAENLAKGFDLVDQLPVVLQPLSFALPLTYGADVLHGAVHGGNLLPYSVDFFALVAFCLVLFGLSLRNIRKHWIA